MSGWPSRKACDCSMNGSLRGTTRPEPWAEAGSTGDSSRMQSRKGAENREMAFMDSDDGGNGLYRVGNRRCARKCHRSCRRCDAEPVQGLAELRVQRRARVHQFTRYRVSEA